MDIDKRIKILEAEIQRLQNLKQRLNTPEFEEWIVQAPEHFWRIRHAYNDYGDFNISFEEFKYKFLTYYSRRSQRNGASVRKVYQKIVV